MTPSAHTRVNSDPATLDDGCTARGWLCRPQVRWQACLVCFLTLVVVGRASADVRPQTMDGPPLLPIPTYEEVGLPPFVMPTGTPLFMPNTPPGNGSPEPGGGGSTGGGSGDGAGSVSMTSMMSRSWGEAASQNAQAVGITPVALAATCQIEAGGCQTNPRSNSTTITGTFQMRDDTYTAMINSALQRNPSLAANAVPGLAGKLDPATQSIAAAEYLRQGAEYLVAHRVPNPTVLDVRGYYNFGPGNAASIARAQDNELMSAQVSGLTAAQFRLNGINPASTTVGEWRAGVINKIGESAARASVLTTQS